MTRLICRLVAWLRIRLRRRRSTPVRLPGYTRDRDLERRVWDALDADPPGTAHVADALGRALIHSESPDVRDAGASEEERYAAFALAAYDLGLIVARDGHLRVLDGGQGK